MRNLINEIHELKDYENYDYDQAITDVEILLNQYNIITAPKSIKLSEIVNKLKNAFVDLGNIDYEGFIEIGYGFITLNDEIVITIDLDSQKIVLIEFTNTFIELKWLYTLWIAGTIIEDDLKEEN